MKDEKENPRQNQIELGKQEWSDRAERHRRSSCEGSSERAGKRASFKAGKLSAARSLRVVEALVPSARLFCVCLSTLNSQPSAAQIDMYPGLRAELALF